MKTPVVVDLESTGLNPFKDELLLVGWSVLGEQVRVLEWVTLDDATKSASRVFLQQYLADPERPVVTMTKFDARFLRLQGWEVNGPFYDIQTAAHVLNENQPLNLDALVQRYLGEKMDKRLQRRAGVVYFRKDNGHEVLLTEVQHDPEAWEQFKSYCYRDVDCEARLWQHLWDLLESTSWLQFFLDECVPFTETLLDVECAGLPVNLRDSEKLREELEEKVANLAPQLLDEGALPPSLNLSSNDQLAAYLYFSVAELVDSLTVEQLCGADSQEYEEWVFGALKECLTGGHEDCEYTDDLSDRQVHVVQLLPEGFSVDRLGRTQVHGRWTFKGRNLPSTEKTESGKLSVSTPTLKYNVEAAQDPWVQKLFEYRQCQKLLTTYLRPNPERVYNGRLWPTYSQTGTKTGRLSSSNPNAQNMPTRGELGKAMRSLFQGDFLVGDYDQVEMRIQASLSEDPQMLRAFREGLDPHLITAQAIFGQDIEAHGEERGIGKTLNFAMGYGAGAKKVAMILALNGYPTTVERAQEYLDELHLLYSRFFSWQEEVKRRVKVRGYVETLGGRHRRLKSAFADRRSWKNVGYGERQAVNAVVQGTAADIIARGMVACRREYPNLPIIGQVHDEVLFEASPSTFSDVAGLQKLFETAHGFELQVPLVFSPHFGDSWYSAKANEDSVEVPEEREELTTGFEEDA